LATVTGAIDFDWKGPKLYFKGKIVARVTPDPIYPNMWRVIRPDGSLSDMANKTRARDAALAQVLRDFNGKETPVGGSYSGPNENPDPAVIS
jgi:hypothetical protein